MPSFLKMKDNTDSFKIYRKDLFNLPMRLLVVGKTGCGKSNILGNLLLQNEMYRKSFEPENIYIFSGSLKGDKKLAIIIDELEVPPENLFHGYSEDEVSEIYDILVEDYNHAISQHEEPQHSILIFDDLSFDGSLRGRGKGDMINKVFCNGRKFLISTVCISQKYTDLATAARENCSAMMLYKSSNAQLEQIEQHFNYLDGETTNKTKKNFINMIRKNTKDKFEFMIFDMEKEEMYRDKEYKPVNPD
jgi:hypothetical protein